MKSIMQQLQFVVTRTVQDVHRISSPKRRLFLRAMQGAAMAAGLALAPWAQAAYPDKPIQIIISFPPAGATDALARAVGQRLAMDLGQSVVVENRPGAGGAIGLVAAARAAPTGYTLYLAATTNQAIAASIYKDQAASLVDDFVPIGQVGFAPHALVVPASSPVKNVAELLEYIRAAPSTYNFASQGVGTLSHLESELFVARNGLKMTHIPYKGSVQALPDVVNGAAVMMFDSVTGSLPLVQAGKLKYLAVASNVRVSLLPDVPTLAEAGVNNVVADNLFGLFAPKGTPQEAITVLSSALERVLNQPDLRKAVASQGAELRYASAADLGKTVVDEHQYWAGVVQQAGIPQQ
jgi:tripartite-type tricarboxylate transporter receptor subunit TctC